MSTTFSMQLDTDDGQDHPIVSGQELNTESMDWEGAGEAQGSGENSGGDAGLDGTEVRSDSSLLSQLSFKSYY